MGVAHMNHLHPSLSPSRGNESVVSTSPGWVAKLLFIAPIVVFSVLFLFHTYPLGLGDIYWHLSTGRWIIEHGTLPTVDPFLYTLPAVLDERQTLLLQGYWLAQVIFYFVHSAFGDYGLVLFKSGLFSTTYFVLWRILRNADVDAVFALLVLVPLPLLFYRYDELRPQVFSFLGVVLVYACVVWSRTALRAGVRWPLSLLMLPVIMLLWANLHRGYILGAVIILVALSAELWRIWCKCRAMDPRIFFRYALVGGGAIVASLVNPMSYHAYLTDLHELGTSVYRGVDEFLPLWNYAALYQQPWLFFVPSGIVAALAVALYGRRRQVHPAQWINFVGFSAMGFTGFRFMILSVLMALATALPHASGMLQPLLMRFRVAVLVATLCAAAAIGILGWQRSALHSGPLETAYVPLAAAEFITSQHPPAPLFSPYEYGGYLEWSLGSGYRLFYDQRSMDNTVYAQYETARDGRYLEPFARYGVRTVVFYLSAPVLNTIPTLVLALLNDEQWDIVFLDTLSVVMVRHDAHSLPVIEKMQAWRTLHATAQRWISVAPSDPNTYVQLGRVWLFSGEFDAARQQFNQALKLDPQHAGALRHLDAMQRLIPKGQ